MMLRHACSSVEETGSAPNRHPRRPPPRLPLPLPPLPHPLPVVTLQSVLPLPELATTIGCSSTDRKEKHKDDEKARTCRFCRAVYTISGGRQRGWSSCCDSILGGEGSFMGKSATTCCARERRIEDVYELSITVPLGWVAQSRLSGCAEKQR